LKQLFVGAEGTLGVVTKVALLCPSFPKSKCAAFLVCQTFDQVTACLQLAKTHLGEILSAFEFMDAQVLELVVQQQQQQDTFALEEIYPYFILVKAHGSNEEHDQAKMDAFVETVLEEGIVVDGVWHKTWINSKTCGRSENCAILLSRPVDTSTSTMYLCNYLIFPTLSTRFERIYRLRPYVRTGGILWMGIYIATLWHRERLTKMKICAKWWTAWFWTKL
jgi:hypothetical protein